MTVYPPNSPSYSSGRHSKTTEFVRENQINEGEIKGPWQEIKPLQRDFADVKKTGPIYAMHRYWTKQPPEVIKHYIEHFCPSNGIVLDPFCGTGTTGSAALSSGRAVVLADLSPLATFIAKNYTEKTDVLKVRSAFAKIRENIHQLLEKTYQTRCPSCEGPAEVKDWIYTEVYLCPTCGGKVPFISPGSPWEVVEKQKRAKDVHCPTCENNFDRDSASYVESTPVGIRYQCKPCKVRKKLKPLDPTDQLFLREIEQEEWDPNIPQVPLPVGVNTAQPFSRNITHTHQFFTKQTGRVLGQLWAQIMAWPDRNVRQKLQFVFTSVVFRVTRLYRVRVQGQGGVLSGTLYLPPIAQDINVWDVVAERLRKVEKGWEELNETLPPNYDSKRIVTTQSATSLSEIPDNSIDYVYTDPPYGGNINYSELNLLWECWFGQTTETELEIIVNEAGQQKGLEEYEALLGQAFREVERTLKPGRWATIVFNSSTPKVWSTVQRAIGTTNLEIAEKLARVGSKMTTAKQTLSRKTARRFILINLQKPPHNSRKNTNDQRNKQKLQDLPNGDLEARVVKEVVKFLEKQGQAHYDEIYDEVITTLVPEVSLRSNFRLEGLLAKHFTHLGDDQWAFRTS